MKRFRVASLAEQDLDDIWYRIATQSSSIGIANGVIESIAEPFPLVASTPKAGTRRDEIESGVQGFPVGRYINYYRESGSVLWSRELFTECATRSRRSTRTRSDGTSIHVPAMLIPE